MSIPLVVAVVAAVLSVTAGIIGGVRLGLLLLRAVIAAMVFGAGAIGVEAVLRKFLPEFFVPAHAEGDGVERTVDIVLDGEEPVPAQASEPAAWTGASADAAEGGDIGELESVEGDSGEEVNAEFPGLDSLEASFQHAAGRSGSQRSGRLSVDIMGAEEDPAEVAKALRTFMKRDEEG